LKGPTSKETQVRRRERKGGGREKGREGGREGRGGECRTLHSPPLPSLPNSQYRVISGLPQ